MCSPGRTASGPPATCVGPRRALRTLGLALLLPALATCYEAEVPDGPRVWLWAWERPERLDFIDPARVGVAYLATTLHLSASGDIRSRLRVQPLRVPPGTHLTAVMRIEVERHAPLDAERRTELVRRIAWLTKDQGSRSVQLDFDARASERPFYRALLHDVRATLPPGTRLAMTALASWCLYDDWLEGLPVDEVVPMVFRMGTDQRPVREGLEERGDFPSPRCRQSVGFVTDEPVPALPTGRRVYWFNPRSWSARDVEHLMEQPS